MPAHPGHQAAQRSLVARQRFHHAPPRHLGGILQWRERRAARGPPHQAPPRQTSQTIPLERSAPTKYSHAGKSGQTACHRADHRDRKGGPPARDAL
eukprot:1311102-Pyramimonas_sp.AAC.1